MSAQEGEPGAELKAEVRSNRVDAKGAHRRGHTPQRSGTKTAPASRRSAKEYGGLEPRAQGRYQVSRQPPVAACSPRRRVAKHSEQ
jgi:hypothetical protein